MMDKPWVMAVLTVLGLAFMFSLFAYGSVTGYSLDAGCKPANFFASIKSKFSPGQFWSDQSKSISEKIRELEFVRVEHILALDRLNKTANAQIEYETAKYVALGITGEPLRLKLQLSVDGMRSEIQMRVSEIQTGIPKEIQRLDECLEVSNKNFSETIAPSPLNKK